LNIFWLIFAVLIWGLIHSLIASLEVKEWLRRRLGDVSVRFYRFGYNVFSVISFTPILWLMIALPDQVLYHIPAPWVYLTLAGQFAAIVVLIVGVLQTGAFAFIGLKQLFYGEEDSAQLVTHGLYRWVRHPLYSAGLLFIWLTPVMSINTLIVILSSTVYIIVGAFFEEHKLEREYGAAYTGYKAATPMFIPGLLIRRNK
jgi:protein-S-isoprenylcysteine O-methyltransferase Ste14